VPFWGKVVWGMGIQGTDIVPKYVHKTAYINVWGGKDVVNLRKNTAL
jgi:hypothetical protein